jgi:hypothetical protein
MSVCDGRLLNCWETSAALLLLISKGFAKVYVLLVLFWDDMHTHRFADMHACSLDRTYKNHILCDYSHLQGLTSHQLDT